MLWKKKEKSPIERQMDEVALMWAREEPGTDDWYLYQGMYLALDERRLEHQKVQKEGAIDAKTWLSTGTTIGLALLTLNFEKMDVLRSKVTNLWLRRRSDR